MNEQQKAYQQATKAVQRAKEKVREAEAQFNKLEAERRALWIEWQEAERGYCAAYERAKAAAKAEIEPAVKSGTKS